MSAQEMAIETLEALRAEHGGLLKEGRDGAGAAGLAEKARRFLDRARQLGKRLDDPADREAAQSVLDYWTATLFTLPKGVSADSPLPSSVAHSPGGAANVVLDEFDRGNIKTAADAAEQWLCGRKADDSPPKIARRVALRLVRMATAEWKFELVPATRASLYDVDPSTSSVDQVVDRLGVAGVVRVTRGSTADTDQVTLRSPDLQQKWPSLRGWLAERSEFREWVEAWDRAGRPADRLYGKEKLDEARSYHDRNALERQFTEASRKKEIRNGEWNEIWMYVYGALALVFLMGLVGTGIFAAKSNANWKLAESKAQEADRQRGIAETNLADAKEQRKRAESEKQEADRQRGIAETNLADAKEQRRLAEEQRKLAEERGEILDAKQGFAEVNSLVRALALLGNATGPERDVAYERIEATQKYKSGRPEIHKFFEDYGKTLESTRKQGSEQKLNGVKLAALNLARSYKNRILKTATSEEAKKFLADERDTIFDVVENCADRIVQSAADGEPYHDAAPYVKEFFVLYWGEMVLVEGEEVEKAMVDFGKVLEGIENRIAERVRSGKNHFKDPKVLDGLTNRQAIQRFYDEAKFGAKEATGRDRPETIAVDERTELPALRTKLEALKKALTAERPRPISTVRPLEFR